MRDLRVRLSPDNLAVKLHNGPGSMARFTVSDDDGRGLLQVIHYGGRVWEEEITVWAQYLASKAVLHQWGAKPRVMETGRRDGGTEIVLSRLDTYAAVDFFPL